MKGNGSERVSDEHLGGTNGPAERAAVLSSHSAAHCGHIPCDSGCTKRRSSRQASIFLGDYEGAQESATLDLGGMEAYRHALSGGGRARRPVSTDRFPGDSASSISYRRDRTRHHSVLGCSWSHESNLDMLRHQAAKPSQADRMNSSHFARLKLPSSCHQVCTSFVVASDCKTEALHELHDSAKSQWTCFQSENGPRKSSNDVLLSRFVTPCCTVCCGKAFWVKCLGKVLGNWLGEIYGRIRPPPLATRLATASSFVETVPSTIRGSEIISTVGSPLISSDG